LKFQTVAEKTEVHFLPHPVDRLAHTSASELQVYINNWLPLKI